VKHGVIKNHDYSYIATYRRTPWSSHMVRFFGTRNLLWPRHGRFFSLQYFSIISWHSQIMSIIGPIGVTKRKVRN